MCSISPEQVGCVKTDQNSLEQEGLLGKMEKHVRFIDRFHTSYDVVGTSGVYLGRSGFMTSLNFKTMDDFSVRLTVHFFA